MGGSNESTNRLLRQHFAKGTDSSVHSQAQIDNGASMIDGTSRFGPADRTGTTRSWVGRSIYPSNRPFRDHDHSPEARR